MNQTSVDHPHRHQSNDVYCKQPSVMLRVNAEVRDVHKRGTGDKGVGINVVERQAQSKPHVSGVGEQGIVVVKSSGNVDARRNLSFELTQVCGNSPFEVGTLPIYQLEHRVARVGLRIPRVILDSALFEDCNNPLADVPVRDHTYRLML